MTKSIVLAAILSAVAITSMAQAPATPKSTATAPAASATAVKPMGDAASKPMKKKAPHHKKVASGAAAASGASK